MAELEKIIEELEKLNVVEINELVKALEERWGVSAQVVAPVAVGAPAPAEGSAEAGEEKTSFDVILKDAGDSKLQVIKIIREVSGLGIKEAKELVDSTPKAIKTGVTKEEGEQLVAKLAEVGAVCELK